MSSHLENPALKHVLTSMSFALALTLVACATDCDKAQDKLDSCADAIEKELASRGTAGSPIGFSDECSEDDRCVANA